MLVALDRLKLRIVWSPFILLQIISKHTTHVMQIRAAHIQHSFGRTTAGTKASGILRIPDACYVLHVHMCGSYVYIFICIYIYAYVYVYVYIN